MGTYSTTTFANLPTIDLAALTDAEVVSLVDLLNTSISSHWNYAKDLNHFFGMEIDIEAKQITFTNASSREAKAYWLLDGLTMLVKRLADHGIIFDAEITLASDGDGDENEYGEIPDDVVNISIAEGQVADEKLVYDADSNAWL